MSGHELAYVANRHFSLVLLNEAIADLVNAHARLDISQAWGDGTAVAADGTHMGTYLDNLLAETSVRYGKPGGIAYHHIVASLGVPGAAPEVPAGRRLLLSATSVADSNSRGS